MNAVSTSVIICTRNRPELLAGTIESVLDGARLPDEIVVIDQSDRPQADLAGLAARADTQIRHIRTTSVGLDRARNEGIRAARGEIIVFIDDDVIVTHGWFGNVIEALCRTGPKGVVTGQVLPGKAKSPGGFAPSTKTDKNPRIYSGRVSADVLFGNNMALYRSAALEVGLFDERLDAGARFPSAGDNDFGYRLLEQGYAISYVPEASVYHLAWRTSRDFVPLRWIYGRGQGAFYAKHFDLHDRYMIGRMASHLMTPVRRFAQRARGRDLRGIVGDLVFSAGLVLGASEWLLSQRGTQPIEDR